MAATSSRAAVRRSRRSWGTVNPWSTISFCLLVSSAIAACLRATKACGSSWAQRHRCPSRQGQNVRVMLLRACTVTCGARLRRLPIDRNVFPTPAAVRDSPSGRCNSIRKSFSLLAPVGVFGHAKKKESPRRQLRKKKSHAQIFSFFVPVFFFFWAIGDRGHFFFVTRTHRLPRKGAMHSRLSKRRAHVRPE